MNYLSGTSLEELAIEAGFDLQKQLINSVNNQHKEVLSWQKDLKSIKEFINFKRGNVYTNQTNVQG